jgi:hypothetical protein
MKDLIEKEIELSKDREDFVSEESWRAYNNNLQAIKREIERVRRDVHSYS